MSKNFIKGGYVVIQKRETVNIDTNEAVQKRLEELREMEVIMEPEESDGFSEGLDPLQVAELVSDESGEGMTALEAAKAREQAEELRREAAAAKESTLQEAKEEADRLLRQTEAECAQMRQDAFNKGHAEGLSQGKIDGEAKAKQEYEERLSGLSAREQELEAMYQSRMQSLEADLVETLTDIYSHVLGISLEGEKSLVLRLLEKTMSTLDTSKNYIIHVAKQDVAEVREKKAYLSKQSGILEENMEIIEDNTLPDGGCLIESDSGIYDCSLGTQLELLGKQLRLISYEKEEV